MKVLVIEDNQKHIDAAKEQLAGHDLMVMTSFRDFFNCIKNGSLLLTEYDAVLTDANLPSIIDNSPADPADAPTGLIIALKALSDGVKYVGVITDANHHMDPVSKGFDFWLHKTKPSVIGQSRLFLLGYDACTYPDAEIYFSELKGILIDKEKISEFGKLFGDANGITCFDPYFKTDMDKNSCKNWARLLRILQEDYLISDVGDYESREHLKMLLQSGRWQ